MEDPTPKMVESLDIKVHKVINGPPLSSGPPIEPPVEVARDTAEGITIAPGKVLLRKFSEDQMSRLFPDLLIPASAMDAHADQKGSAFPMAEVLAIGPKLRGTHELEAMEEVLEPFLVRGDRVWFDYRGCGQIYWRGEELLVAPRQYIIAKVLR